MPENVITVESLVKNYGKFPAVCGVTFSVRRGEVFALLGPNGAGKTTIVEILELLKSPTNGYVSILGDGILTGNFEVNRDYRGIKERIGVLPQNFSSFDLLTVYENIDYFAQMYSKHIGVDGLIEELGLKEKRNALFKDLSGGLKQRVGIAIALVNDPEVVFLDEPTTGLDPRARRGVWDIIKGLKARGKTVLLTTHYMDEAYHLADRICILNRGHIVADGSPEDLINRYGGGNTLVARGCDAGAIERLMEALPGSQVSGYDVFVKLPDGDGVSAMSRAVSLLGDNSCTCKELYVKKPALEDVFLNLTGESLDNGMN